METQLGRKKPQIIRDPELEPFYIEKDSNNYSVYETRMSDRGKRGTKVEPREVNSLIGHYTSFQNALRRVCKEKFTENKDDFASIKEYIETWSTLKSDIEELFNKIEF